ncbi:MAG: DUF2309 domain-containing protein [Lacisediminihabitans sp.]
MSTLADRGDASRAQLRAEVALLASAITPAWPIHTFIATNPLSGLERMPFDEAIIAIGQTGARGVMGEQFWRSEHARGRITRADLMGAIERRIPAVNSLPAVAFGGQDVSTVDLLIDDLLLGISPSMPVCRAKTAAERVGQAVAGTVDDLTVKWVSAFVGAPTTPWAMPGSEEGFYTAWRQLAVLDPAIPPRVQRQLRRLPETEEAAVLDALDSLRVPLRHRREYMQIHLNRLPGWVAHIRWRMDNRGDFDLLGYLAMRLSYEAALIGPDVSFLIDADVVDLATGTPTGPAHRAAHLAWTFGHPLDASELDGVAGALALLPAVDRSGLWLDAYEAHYRDGLLRSLDRPGALQDASRPAAQLAFCIDTRSEGIRRHLEESGAWETFGFAGFFAVAIRYQDLAGGAPTALCPVLIRPRNDVKERPAPGTERQANRQVDRLRAIANVSDAFHAAQKNMLSSFALAEATGWLAGTVAAARTFSPRAWSTFRSRVSGRATHAAPTVLSVQEGFTFEERALFAEVALTMMGLTARFARLVVLCGHGSSTENNPFQAALDCGACGGQRGTPNARTAAAILNGTEVRTHLVRKGIDIPDDTWFIAGDHDTATDRVRLLDLHLVPGTHKDDVKALESDLLDAGARLAVERCATLPGAPKRLSTAAAARHVRTRSADWGQVYPEWGLAGNAAFVIGPRAMTHGLNLERRVFLHSYDAEIDRDGTALENILTAPMVVAQWINAQYYFSTVDPERYGAGTKTIHNVTAGIGVLSGGSGDLQSGLPWQSVRVGESLVHEPMRLLTIVEAPRERISAIIACTPLLRTLFDNGWVALTARDAPGHPWHRYTPQGWAPWFAEGDTE